jgi:hypothetical protein
MDALRQVLPDQEKVGFGFKIVGVESRKKDGGAFLTFAYRPESTAMQRSHGHVRAIPSGTTLSEAEAATLSVINTRIRPHLRPIHSYAFSPAKLLPVSWQPRPSVHIVLGTPWLEDLARFPSRVLNIAFIEGGVPTEQELWEILRPYGRLVKMEINTKENKASVTFNRTRSATSARNCLYGATVGKRKLVIDYVAPLHAHKIYDWLSNHPRIVLPILAFFLGTITYAVFDPVRSFFIKSSVENTFSLSDYRIYAWLKRNTVALFQGENEKRDSSLDDWWERKAAVNEIQGWLRETPSTFITIAGPRGSGKHPLLKRATGNKSVKHLTIHCEEISHTAKGDESTLVPALANQVGYFPVFSWISSLNNLIDLAAVGLIGSKAGFSTPTDAQLKQVLNVTTTALVEIKAETLRKKEKEAKRVVKDKNAKESLAKVEAGKMGGVQTPTPALTAADKKIVASPAKSMQGDELGTDAAILASEQSTTDDRGYDAPVVILDGFHHKGLQSELLWNVLATWAADVVTSGVAHVVFVSDNPVAMAKTLGRALPNIPFQSITLADADEEKARGYVFSKLKELGRADKGKKITVEEGGVGTTSTRSKIASLLTGSQKPDALPANITRSPIDAQSEKLDEETAKWIDLLGGRLTDLEACVQKVALGYTVETAVKDIIARTVVEIRKNAFGDDLEDAKSLPWTRGQAWLIVEQLAKKDELPYYSLLHDGLKGDELALKAMEQAELISVRHVEGRPGSIRAGRPVILQALKELCRDGVFANTQRYLSNTSSIASSEKTIRETEAEIRELGECFQLTGNIAKSSQATRERLEHLLNTLGVHQAKIKKLEDSNAELSKSLADDLINRAR